MVDTHCNASSTIFVKPWTSTVSAQPTSGFGGPRPAPPTSGAAGVTRAAGSRRTVRRLRCTAMGRRSSDSRRRTRQRGPCTPRQRALRSADRPGNRHPAVTRAEVTAQEVTAHEVNRPRGRAPSRPGRSLKEPNQLRCPDGRRGPRCSVQRAGRRPTVTETPGFALGLVAVEAIGAPGGRRPLAAADAFADQPSAGPARRDRAIRRRRAPRGPGWWRGGGAGRAAGRPPRRWGRASGPASWGGPGRSRPGPRG